MKRVLVGFVLAAITVSGLVGAPVRAGAAEREDRPAHECARDEGDGDACRPLGVEVESGAEIANTGFQAAMRFDNGFGSDRASLAAEQTARLAANQAKVPGAAGRWSPVDKGPVVFGDPKYDNQLSVATGLKRAQGRITDFAFDAQHDRLFAAFGHGGVWASDNRGESWVSVGETLPTQNIGAVAYSPAGGGTLLVLTGDNSFGSLANDAGQGIFWSTDRGASWHKASGAPEGVLAFRLAVRDDAPATIYAATGAGLYRSIDAGRSWTDTVLPTGACAGRTSAPNCFLANMVTDVQVQSADHFGHPGGAVVAAVGWKAGTHLNFDGKPESSANGIYTSPTGAPGSFRRGGNGLPGPEVLGRTALGAASGPAQNHGYVYALVQDARIWSTNRLEGIKRLPEILDETGLFVADTTLKGVYVSADFGQHWVLMADRNVFGAPVNGSSLAAFKNVLQNAPGGQAWYDEWVTPDPTSQVGGIPTNLFVGLEEVWQTRTAGLPQVGPTAFQAVAPYSNLGGAFLGCVAVAVVDGDCRTLASTRPPSVHPDGHAGIVLPARGPGKPDLLVGTDGGAYRAAIPPVGLIQPGAFGLGRHRGLNTLVSYSVAPSTDGVVYSGLQDNGTVRIDPKRGMQPVEIFGGDGTLVVSDPHDSNQVLMAPPKSDLNISHDGGATKTDIEPSDGVRAKVFLTPFVVDELDAKSVLYGARDLYSAAGPLSSLTQERWHKAFDLGTLAHPAQATAVATDSDPNLRATALALRGGVGYAGYCPDLCSTQRKRGARFRSGIATNVGGRWHIAAAHGLPSRVINGLAIDPDDPRIVYVALGASTDTQWLPTGAVGNDGVDGSGGHLYRSADGGESFRDISGALPDTGLSSVLVHGRQLVVGTGPGVFMSSSRTGGTWAPLGTGLPAVDVWTIAPDPGDGNQLYAATYGRGIWRYRLR